MGSSSSSDNSYQVNKNINNLRNQINDLQNFIDNLNNNINNQQTIIINNFVHIEEKITIINNNFTDTLNIMKNNCLCLENNINKINNNFLNFQNSYENNLYENEKYLYWINYKNKIFYDINNLRQIHNDIEFDMIKQFNKFMLLKNNYIEKNNYLTMIHLNEKNNYLLNHIIENQQNKIKEFDVTMFNDIKLNIQPFKIDDNIVELYLSVDRFDELRMVENNLLEKINIKKNNLINNELLNPLDKKVDCGELATKFYNSGIKTVRDINFNNDDNFLTVNNYNYILEIRYTELINKFIDGCIKNDLKLDWINEDFNILCNYIYKNSEYKSVHKIYKFSKKSIYNINKNIQLEIYNYYKNNNLLLDLQYEDISFLKKIFKTEIDNKIIIDKGYKPISKYGINKLNYLLFNKQIKLEIENIDLIVKYLINIIQPKFCINILLTEIIIKFFVSYHEFIKNDLKYFKPKLNMSIIMYYLSKDKILTYKYIVITYDILLKIYWNESFCKKIEKN